MCECVCRCVCIGVCRRLLVRRLRDPKQTVVLGGGKQHTLLNYIDQTRWCSQPILR